MTARNPAPVRRQRWLQRRVSDRLRDVVGGPARFRVVVLLAGVLALSSADAATAGASAVQLEAALRIGNTDIGLLVTASTAVAVLVTLPLGALADRVNRTNLLAGAIVTWSLAMLVGGASNSYLMLLITRLALGAVVATAGPVVASLTGVLAGAIQDAHVRPHERLVVHGDSAGRSLWWAVRYVLSIRTNRVLRDRLWFQEVSELSVRTAEDPVTVSRH